MLHQRATLPLAEERSFNSHGKKRMLTVGELRYTWEGHTQKQLQQYFEVRQKTYADHLGLKYFSGKLDWEDLNSEILLVLSGEECVGGARLTVHSDEVNPHLPLEEKGFILKELFPDLNLENATYGELSRLALLSEYRDGIQSEILYEHIGDKCKELNIKYLFSVSPYNQARRVRRVALSHGFGAEIFKDIRVPPKPIYEGVEMVLSMVITPGVS